MASISSFDFCYIWPKLTMSHCRGNLLGDRVRENQHWFLCVCEILMKHTERQLRYLWESVIILMNLFWNLDASFASIHKFWRTFFFSMRISSDKKNVPFLSASACTHYTVNVLSDLHITVIINVSWQIYFTLIWITMHFSRHTFFVCLLEFFSSPCPRLSLTHTHTLSFFVFGYLLSC